jgi:hypothetical protein
VFFERNKYKTDLVCGIYMVGSCRAVFLLFSVVLLFTVVCNNFNAEGQAIVSDAESFRIPNPTDTTPGVFLTNAKSVLEALENRKLHELRKLLYEICAHGIIVLQWIPPPCGITGNEIADRLAKESTLMQQAVCAITYQQKKDMIFSCRRFTTSQQDEYHLLDRVAQVIIFRLRTGHNRLKAHIFSKLFLPNFGVRTMHNDKKDIEEGARGVFLRGKAVVA